MSGPNTNAAGTASVLNVLAGLWLIISPFILTYANLPAAMWGTIAVGIVVLIFAWIRVANPGQYVGLSWLNFLLGIWLIISPFVLGYSAFPRATWNDVILGIIVLILGACSAFVTPPLPSRLNR
jgi:hypothetical protein